MLASATVHPHCVGQARFRFGEEIMRALTRILNDLETKRCAKSCAKSLFRLAAILAATLSVGSCFAPAVRGIAPSDSLPLDDAKFESANVAIPVPLRPFLLMAGI